MLASSTSCRAARPRCHGVLKKLTQVVKMYRLEVNSLLSAPPRQTIQFARAGETIKTLCQKGTARLLAPGSKWSMRIDLKKQLQFPREIIKTSLQPDIVLATSQATARASAGGGRIRFLPSLRHQMYWG